MTIQNNNKTSDYFTEILNTKKYENIRIKRELKSMYILYDSTFDMSDEEKTIGDIYEENDILKFKKNKADEIKLVNEKFKKSKYKYKQDDYIQLIYLDKIYYFKFYDFFNEYEYNTDNGKYEDEYGDTILDDISNYYNLYMNIEEFNNYLYENKLFYDILNVKIDFNNKFYFIKNNSNNNLWEMFDVNLNQINKELNIKYIDIYNNGRYIIDKNILMNEEGKIINNEYSYIENFSDNQVTFGTKDGIIYLIDLNGNIIGNDRYNKSNEFVNGYAIVLGYSNDEYYHIDTYGKRVGKYKFELLRNFNEFGLARVEYIIMKYGFIKQNKQNFINTNGKLIIEDGFDDLIEDFSGKESKAVIRIGKKEFKMDNKGFTKEFKRYGF